MIGSIKSHTVSLLVAAIAVASSAGSALAQDPVDILFYGNSFTIAVGFGSTRNVPDLVKAIAVSAGHPEPRTRNASAAGQGFVYHLNNNTNVITTGITAGEKWDFVVLQDFSTEPTHIGNLASHRSSAVALYQRVALHSPDVVPIMFETWARAPGFSYYTGANPAFPGGPAQMQQEVRDGYHLSTQDINAAAGANIARFAPVGDAWEDAGFPLNFYASDRYHAQNRGTLLTALVLYQTIYNDLTTSDIPLGAILTSLNISTQDGMLLTSLADGTRVPEPATQALVGGAAYVLASMRRRISVKCNRES